MPYMTGYTDDVENALFLRRFGVPYWALTHVFGHDDMYWQRLEERLGRNSIVGTTIKDPDKLLEDLLADEKHTRLNGEKAYIATTVGADCVLGASVVLQADEKSLKEAYGHFKTEDQNPSADYKPKTYPLNILGQGQRRAVLLTATGSDSKSDLLSPQLFEKIPQNGHRRLESNVVSLAEFILFDHDHRMLSARIHQDPKALQAYEGTLLRNLPTGLGCLSHC